MLTDVFGRVSNAQAITGSAVSTNSFDLSTSNRLRDAGRGETLALYLTVTEAFSDGPTLAIGIILATDTALTTGVLGITRTYPLTSAQLTLGAEYELLVPSLTVALLAANGKRYAGADFVVASGPFTLGKVSAFFGPRVATKPRTYTVGAVGP